MKKTTWVIIVAVVVVIASFGFVKIILGNNNFLFKPFTHKAMSAQAEQAVVITEESLNLNIDNKDTKVISNTAPNLELKPSEMPTTSATPEPTPDRTPEPTIEAPVWEEKEEIEEAEEKKEELEKIEEENIQLAQYMIRLEDSATAEIVDGKIKIDDEWVVINKTNRPGIYVISIDSKKKDQLEAIQSVVQVQKDHLREAMVLPDDEYYAEKQWYLTSNEFEKVWEYTQGNQKVVVAVIDSGVSNHADMTKNIVKPYNTVTEEEVFPNVAVAPLQKENEHGTFISGIIAAQMNNGIGITGIAPNTSIMPINIFSWITEVEGAPKDGYYCYDSDLIDAIYYATDNGANIINLSVGGSEDSELMKAAIDYAVSKGVLIIAAAGNDNSENSSYPAAYENVLAVGSVNKEGNRSSFSNYGDYVDVYAQGEEVFGLTLKGYDTGSGTSVSAAMVSGLAALIKAEDESLTAEQIKNILISNKAQNTGIIQPLNTVQSIQPFTIETSSMEIVPVVEQEIGQETTITNNVKYYGRGDIHYRFTIKKLDSQNWTIIKDWSESNKVSINPEVVGEYVLRVQQTSSTNLTAENGVVDESLVKENLSNYLIKDIPKQVSIQLKTEQTSPQEAGATVQIEAINKSDSTIAERAEYKFELLKGDEIIVLKDWSKDTSIDWLSDTPGTYGFKVYSRTSGRSNYDTVNQLDNFIIEIPRQKSVEIKIDDSQVFERGETIQVNAVVGESPSSNKAEFQWLINGEIVQSWGASSQYTWVLTEVGNYDVEVQTRTSGREGVDTKVVRTFEIKKPPLDADVELVIEPQNYGKTTELPIVLTANAIVEQESKNTYEYQFSVKTGEGDYETVQAWSTANTYDWSPQAVGKYDLKTEIRLTGDEVEKNECTIFNYYVVEESVIDSLNVTLASDNKIEIGQPVKVNIEAILKDQQAQNLIITKVVMEKEDGAYEIIQDWSSIQPEIIWVPNQIESFTVRVFVKAEGEAEYQTVQQTTGIIQVVDLPKQKDIAIKVEGDAIIGHALDISASTSSEAELAAKALYQFELINAVGESLVLKEWSKDKMLTWTPNEVGAFTLRAYIKTEGGQDYRQFAEQVYKVQMPPQEGVTLTASHQQVEIGQSIVVSAEPSGENETLKQQAEYQFIINDAVIQGWSSAKQCTYKTNAVGIINASVQIRTAGRDTVDAEAKKEFTVIDIPKQPNFTIALDKPARQPVGTQINITVTPSNIDLATRAEYRFLIDGVIVRGWSATSSYVWTTYNEAIHTIKVEARTQGRSGVDSMAQIEGYETGIIPLSSVTLKTDKPSPQLIGQRITLQAVVDGYHKGDAQYLFEVKDKQSGQWFALADYINSNQIAWTPNKAGEYSIRISARASGRSSYDVQTLIQNFVISGKVFNTINFSYTLNDMVSYQMKFNPQTNRPNDGLGWVSANSDEVKYYVNPENFKTGDQLYQYLKLTAVQGITTNDANNMLQSKGVLSGKGASFLQAQQKYDVNVAYLISHALLETGNGTSQLATGVYVDSVDGKPVAGKTVYNMYGIGAYDSDPVRLGAEYAYKQGWFSVESAIVEGAYWIGRYYIHRDTYNGDPAQDSIYEMRWNPEAIQRQLNQGILSANIMPKHQYATDIGWATKQVSKIKQLLDLCEAPILEFNIPNY